MKKLPFIILITMSLISCDAQEQSKKPQVNKPWNISIYLDLSDRLTTGQGTPQLQRDTAIISYVIDQFVENVVKHKIVPCNDKIKVFFYPTIGINNADALANQLTLNLEDYKTNPAEKRKKLISLKTDFMNALLPIYQQTLQNNNWLGSDIWGFFKKSIKISCVDENYRNILIILTDGYIYHKSSATRQGTNEYSYILSSNINQSGMKLIKCNEGLDDLEVLVLEVNPTQQSHSDKLESIIGTWLTEMGVARYQIQETDVTANITPAIKQFLK